MIVVSEGIEDQVPPEYAELFGITTLVCTPLSAAGHVYGVICADRGGGHFELTDGERHLLWTLGKTAALVATARNATRQQERTRRLDERLELAREIHERVMQRLFGVSLALSAERALDAEQQERCRVEMQEALSDLRNALERPLAPVATADRHDAARRAGARARATAGPGSWPSSGPTGWRCRPRPSRWPSRCSPRRCATSPSTPPRRRSTWLLCADADTFTLEIRNDGVRSTARGTGMGLRLAAFEALQHGGMVEFGPAEPGGWRVRLVVPTSSSEARS